MVFDDDFYAVSFMREGTIPPNWTDFVQRRSESGAPDNNYPKDTWFTPDIEEDPRENLTQVPKVTP